MLGQGDLLGCRQCFEQGEVYHKQTAEMAKKLRETIVTLHAEAETLLQEREALEPSIGPLNAEMHNKFGDMQPFKTKEYTPPLRFRRQAEMSEDLPESVQAEVKRMREARQQKKENIVEARHGEEEDAAKEKDWKEFERWEQRELKEATQKAEALKKAAQTILSEASEKSRMLRKEAKEKTAEAEYRARAALLPRDRDAIIQEAMMRRVELFEEGDNIDLAANDEAQAKQAEAEALVRDVSCLFVG